MMPLRGSDWSATKLVISPFTDFATKLTPLGALPTPLAQLVHAHGSSLAYQRDQRDGEGTLLKPRRVVHFSQQPARPGQHAAHPLAEREYDGAEHGDADPLTDLSEPSDLLHNPPHSEPSARTPFAESQMGLPDWARGVDDDVSSLGHVLSIQPTQRGLSPLTSHETDAERARKQALHKRRLQFEGGEAALEMQAAAATPLRAQRADGSEEPWLLFRDSAILGTPTTGGCETLTLPLGTPDSLKEAFRARDAMAPARPRGFAPVHARHPPPPEPHASRARSLARSLARSRRAGWSEGPAGKFKTKSMTAGAEPEKDPTAQTLDLQDEVAGTSKPKRERGGKENGKGGKPRTCNCKHSKCIKLYATASARRRDGPSPRCARVTIRSPCPPFARAAPRALGRRYCDCFSAGQFCLASCKCDSCLNNADNEPAREEARKSILERNHHAFTDKVKRLKEVRAQPEQPRAPRPASARAAQRPSSLARTSRSRPRRACATGGLEPEGLQLQELALREEVLRVLPGGRLVHGAVQVHRLRQRKAGRRRRGRGSARGGRRPRRRGGGGGARRALALGLHLAHGAA
jgi:hypothetical protein